MNRSMILIVGLTGAAGLAIGWVASGSRTEPASARAHKALKPPTPAIGEQRGPSDSDSAPDRVEFPLRPEDAANDRETPAVAADAEGRVVVAWAAQSGEVERTIHVARSVDGGRHFEPPVPFRKVPIYRFTSSGKGKAQGKGKGKGKAMAFSTHVLPRLVATAGALELAWVEAVDGGPEVVEYVARSTDGGRTFSAPAPVHGKGAKRPGFTTLSAAPDGTLLAAWLDGRDGGQQPFFAARGAGSEGFDAERKVYAGPEGQGICPCCDLAAARLPDGSDVVAFRNSEGGHRDIWLARAPRGGPFGPPSPLAQDHWSFEGCPHDGPSLALFEERLHVAWMSAHDGRNRVYVASAPASDPAAISAPRLLNPGAAGAQGHPKLANAGPGRLFAVWDESLDNAPPTPHSAQGEGHAQAHGHGPALTGGGRSVMLAAGDRKGFGPAAALAPRAGAFQLNPSLAVGRDGAALVVWNEIDTAGKRVVFVRREPTDGGH